MRVTLAALHHEHAHLFAVCIGSRKCHGVAGAHFRLRFRHVFQVLRPDIATVDNDEVFLASGDGEHAIHHVADIAGIQPAVVAECVAGFFRQVEVPGHDARAAQVNDASLPVAEDFAVVANFDFKVGQGHAAVDEVAAAAAAPGVLNQYGFVIVRQVVGIDVMRAKACPQR